MSDSVITDITGDLFSAPENSILLHACNTEGVWGSGIAVAFRGRFPDQYEQYKQHCADNADGLVGTCLLLQAGAYTIGCLFTSRSYGENKDEPDQILSATEAALKDLVRQNTEGKELHACRFNSGRFSVPWKRTASVIEMLGIAVTVYTPAQYLN